MVWRFVVVAAAICVQLWCGLSVAQELRKSPYDKSRSRHFVLENGLRVIVVSDPNFNSAAAALAVDVGSLADLREHQGLAHFLEHMLFLGTKKYPDVDDYGRYLKENGGYANAYTAPDQTNYHFEVRPAAFEGALDRFAQFFITPLFDARYTEREMHAVQSEHQKNLQNDRWRQRQLQRQHLKQGHPAAAFSTGNMDTLKGVTPEVLQNFYTTHYSANRMALTLLGPATLDVLEEQARRHFAPITNRNLKQLRYDAVFYEQRAALRTIEFEPIKDRRSIEYRFALPGVDHLYEAKVLTLIGAHIGHEGRGSLLSYLKAKGWATGLSAGGYGETVDYGYFAIQIELTPQGLVERAAITRALFSYIELLRREGVAKRFFEEQKRLATLAYRYDDKGEGSERASQLAASMLRYPLSEVEQVPYLHRRFDPAAIAAMLDHLRPESLLITVAAKGVVTDAVEPYYGTRYRYREEAGEPYAQLLQPEVMPALQRPAVNPFIPESAALAAVQPLKIEEGAGWATWYAHDDKHKRPKALAAFSFRLPADSAPTLREAALQKLYAAVVAEQVNEISYPAYEAGLDYEISAHQNAITLRIEGYSSSLHKLQERLLPHLRTITIEEERFAALKERLLRAGESFVLSPAWQIGREYSRALRKKSYFLADEMAQEMKSIDRDELQRFGRGIFARGFLRSFIYGSISADGAKRLASAARSALLVEGWQPIDRAQRRRSEVMVEGAGASHRIVSRALPGNNSCLWRSYYLGHGSVPLRAAALLVGAALKQPFYTEMRTEQQLGYIVFSATPDDANNYYLFLIVQSATHGPDAIAAQVDSFVDTLPAQLEKISAQQFQQLKEGVIHRLAEKPTSVVAEGVRMYDNTFNRQGSFGRDDETIAFIETISKSELLKMVQSRLRPATARLIDLHLFAQQHTKPTDFEKTAITPAQFKESAEFAPARY